MKRGEKRRNVASACVIRIILPIFPDSSTIHLRASGMDFSSAKSLTIAVELSDKAIRMMR